MSALQRVQASLAGQQALGILVPPGERTILVLRPRSLAWDALLTRGGADAAFREMDRDEAARVAEAVYRALVRWNEGGSGHVDALWSAERSGHVVWIDVEEHSFVTCERRPGRPYAPHVFPENAQAARAVEQVREALCPSSASRREVYLNTKNFLREPPGA